MLLQRAASSQSSGLSVHLSQYTGLFLRYTILAGNNRSMKQSIQLGYSGKNHEIRDTTGLPGFYYGR